MSTRIICVIAYVLLAPIIGGLFDGMDRKISARMQRRVGPPLLQPFYDVKKLFSKQWIAVTNDQTFMLLTYLILMIFTGGMFYSGSDILMCFFMLSTTGLFMFFTACITDSPYSSIGAQRELIQEMSCEPAILMTSLGFYLVEGTFEGSSIIHAKTSSLLYMPGLFAAYVFILTIKMRKSPFDESTSHHPHQELVKGITSDLGSANLAIFQIAEWYENVFLMGITALFIVNSSFAVSIPAAVLVVIAVYFLEILIDNTSARVRWGTMLILSWGVTLAAGGLNLLILMIVK